MQRTNTEQMTFKKRELTSEQIENKAFHIFDLMTQHLLTPEARTHYFDQLFNDDTDTNETIKILEKTRFFIEAKRLVKRAANRKEAEKYAYPGNQADSDGIRYADAMHNELANDPEVANLAALRHELGVYISAKKTEIEKQQLAAQQAVISVTKINLHRENSATKSTLSNQSKTKKLKY